MKQMKFIPQCIDAIKWLELWAKQKGWTPGQPGTPSVSAREITELLAGRTGQDGEALRAFAHVCRLLTVADDPGRRAGILAARALLDTMQPKMKPLARELIAQAWEWSMRDKVWIQILGLAPDREIVIYEAQAREDHAAASEGRTPRLIATESDALEVPGVGLPPGHPGLGKHRDKQNAAG